MNVMHSRELCCATQAGTDQKVQMSAALKQTLKPHKCAIVEMKCKHVCPFVCSFVKGLVHQKMKFSPCFTHPQSILGVYDFLLSDECNWSYIKIFPCSSKC